MELEKRLTQVYAILILKYNHTIHDLEDKYKDKIVSALFLMIKGEYAHIHLSGSIYEYLKLGVNNKIKHDATLISRKLGAKYFHFGGGNSSDVEDPLFKFKSNFSKERGDFYIGKKIYNQEVYNKICNID